MELKHLVIIPDGNRRWARARKRPVFYGHQKGAEKLEEITRFVFEKEIPYFSFWGLSILNIEKRPRQEIKFLFYLFEKYFKKLLKDPFIYEKKIKIRVLGFLNKYLPQRLIKIINDLEKESANHNKFNLNIFLAYSGKKEMIEAVKKISQVKLKNRRLKIDEKTLKSFLLTKDLPAVDLLIRTGGEPHFSDGFLMFDLSDAYFYFLEKLWPDFSKKDLEKVIKFYLKAEKRKGR